MTDHIADSPYIARQWCPGCEPTADPLREVLDERRCEQHNGGTEGTADRLVTHAVYIGGSGEAGGEPNRLFCDLIHRPPGAAQ